MLDLACGQGLAARAPARAGAAQVTGLALTDIPDLARTLAATGKAFTDTWNNSY